MKRILFITSNYHTCPIESDNTKCINNTGVWLEEFAVPYFKFKDSGFSIELSSPTGGISYVDKSSIFKSNPSEWDECVKLLENTKKLEDINIDDFDCVYLAGGHATMFDFPNSEILKETIEKFYNSGKIIGAICHGVVGLTTAKDTNGEFILKGKKVTAFSNEEEKLSGFEFKLPFLLEDRIREIGGDFVSDIAWSAHIETSGNIITGQNQTSTIMLADKILEVLC